ncbi:MAG: hypothetical protein Q9190_002223 [Brigantiaea leucoxantha]
MEKLVNEAFAYLTPSHARGVEDGKESKTEILAKAAEWTGWRFLATSRSSQAESRQRPLSRNKCRIITRTTTRQLSLAYSVQKPLEHPDNEVHSEPIIFLHGLFGSKENYKSMSR